MPCCFQGHPSNFKFTWDKIKWPEWSVSGLQLQLEFTDGFEIMHKAWYSIEQAPYCCARSSIRFEGHTHRQFDDLNPIWVRLLSRLQLWNPSTLFCCVEQTRYSTLFSEVTKVILLLMHWSYHSLALSQRYALYAVDIVLLSWSHVTSS